MGLLCSRSRSQQIPKCQWMFVRMISSKPPNILLQNLVWWCIVMIRSAMQKRPVCCIHCQGHSKGLYDQNMTASTVSSELLICLLPILVWWYIIISQNVLWRNGIVVFKVKVTANFKMLLNVSPDDMFWITEHFTTKLGMVMHHYEPDCLPKRLVCCLQGQGHGEGSYNQNMTFYLLNCWSFCNYTLQNGTSL